MSNLLKDNVDNDASMIYEGTYSSICPQSVRYKNLNKR